MLCVEKSKLGLIIVIGLYFTYFNFIVSGKNLVVEGQEGGVMRDGTHWPDNQISSGRFCSVFEFSDNLITRMYIYVDPDFSSQDNARISILSR